MNTLTTKPRADVAAIKARSENWPGVRNTPTDALIDRVRLLEEITLLHDVVDAASGYSVGGIPHDGLCAYVGAFGECDCGSALLNAALTTYREWVEQEGGK